MCTHIFLFICNFAEAYFRHPIVLHIRHTHTYIHTAHVLRKSQFQTYYMQLPFVYRNEQKKIIQNKLIKFHI